MNSPHIAVSGATSCTGLWIARHFSAQGWRVSALSGSLSLQSYSGTRLRRAELLSRSPLHVYWGVRAEEGAMAKWILQNRPEIWVHHHHPMENFRSADYNFKRAVDEGITPLLGILEALSQVKCKGIIFTGTYFEPGEGALSESGQAITPYAQSKHDVWVAMQKECSRLGLALSKFVTPNPIGPLENDDRLVPNLVKKAREGATLVLNTPAAMTDQLPMSALTAVYAELAGKLLQSRQASIARPSGWVCTVAQWSAHVNQEFIEKYLGLKPCRIEISDPLAGGKNGHKNREPVKNLDWPALWKEYSRFAG